MERLDFFATFFWMPSGRSFCIQGDWVARAGHVLAFLKIMRELHIAAQKLAG